MAFEWKKKLCSAVSAISVFAASFASIPAYAVQDNIEIVLTDITHDSESTLRGEAKIKVSVKGAGGSVTAVQTALKFSGDLNYKSIEFLQGENNPPECFHIPPNAALANTSKTILPGIVTNRSGSMDFGDEQTDLFILTFAGDPGDKITLSLNRESEADTYCAVDGSFIELDDNAKESVTATASSEDNEGTEAVVKLVMDKIDDFTVSTGSGYADSKITLVITNEETGATISTVLNTVSNKKGGHYDSGSSVPTFIVKNTVVSGDTYTVELNGNGYVSYRQTGVDFGEEILLTNDDFIPGDINSDGKVDSKDKSAFSELLSGDYSNYESEYADFNRDGIVNKYDDIFSDISDEPDEDKKTAPEKMDVPSVDGGKKKITVKWTAPKDGGSEITGYIIKYGTSKTSLNKTEEIKDADDTSVTISDLGAGKTYYVQIAAVNAIGVGEYSDIKSAKTDEEETSDNGGGGGGSGGGGGGGTTPAVPSVPSNPTVPQNPNEPFVDLGNYAWAKESIYTLKDKGIISGVSATEFAPANNIKRGDFILILTRMLGVNEEFSENFADVPASSYYYNAIGSAKAAGIAQGSENCFMPENSITRQDLITLAYRAFLAKGYISETDDFSSLDAFGDKDTISDYAKAPMASMVSAGIIKGSDGNVNPLGYATRAEVAVMCARLLALMN
ncbi:MAG: S-layer homology domain-containing protein [Clostridia bacterium]|nr:S-layer homology domain-containing protein [Clostridia bacterium]